MKHMLCVGYRRNGISIIDTGKDKEPMRFLGVNVQWPGSQSSGTVGDQEGQAQDDNPPVLPRGGRLTSEESSLATERILNDKCPSCGVGTPMGNNVYCDGCHTYDPDQSPYCGDPWSGWRGERSTY
jgi:hypothetical protein